MDFLDPKKQRQHAILLHVGYFFIGIAIIISTIVLVYQANGFGVNSKGEVVQNGLVFFSSQPSPADIYLNGTRNEAQTNSRLSLAAGQYDVRLSKSGYRDWNHRLNVQGGDVQHFDYPLLFPKTLATKKYADYNAAPGVSAQSRDHRWLVVQQTPTATSFNVYDLKNPTDPVVEVSLPSNVVTSSTATQSWQFVQWADDNQHVLLQHIYGSASEYIMLDRDDATKSVNLNQTLSANPTSLTLVDNKYDQYHLFNATAGELSTATLNDPKPVKVLSDVISYKSYGSKTLLYATTNNAPTGKVLINIVSGDTTYTIRQAAAGTNYLLDMAGYSGTPYVVVGAASENMVYMYKDPIAQLRDASVKAPVASRAIKVPNPNYVSFSPNAQYIMVEGGNQFGVYDIYLKHAYVYNAPNVIDAPQAHASWMDGNRLTYVSNGKVVVFDYDHKNTQTLVAANSNHLPFFSPDYHYMYAVTPANEAGKVQITQSPLLTSSDL